MLTRLTDALANQFDDAGLSKVVVRRAGIQDGLVRYDDLAIVRWQTIVERAIQQEKLEALVEAAVEVSDNASLRKLFEESKTSPAAPAEPHRKPLPYPWLTPWVGREHEMATLEEALQASRLVTLHGTGGVGKTRLAIETVRERGGGVWVALESVPDKPDSVLAAVRDALGLTEVDAPGLDALCRKLEGAGLLLLLDNFESVMSAVDLVQRLAGTVGVQCLVTSQRVLGLPGERVIELEPMESNAGAHLFTELARQRDARWQPEDDAALREILAATDGLPYLIELVAAAAPKRRLRQLAGELKTRLKEVRARHALVERQSSVQACLEWALAHLPAEERNALPRLAIFAGSFDETAALEIAETPIASLDVLVDASLLRFNREAGRYSMLSTTRQFARELQNEEEHTRLAGAHARWFIERLDQANRALQAKGAETQMAARRWIDTEVANVQQAVEWAEEREPELFERAVFAYADYLDQRCRFSENVRLHEALLRRLSFEDTPQVWARIQNNLGNVYWSLPTGDRSENLAKAIACFEADLRVWTEHDFPADWATTQNNLGITYRSLPTGDRSKNLEKAIACYEAALRVWTERDFPRVWATAQNNLGIAYVELPTGDGSENFEKAILCYEAALRVRTEHDFPADWAMTQNNLGNAYARLPTGDRTENLGKAIACFEAALRVRTERDLPVAWATTQNNLGNAYGDLPAGDRSENLAKAIAHYEAALRVGTERDFPMMWAMTQYNLGLTYEQLKSTENRRNAIRCYESAARGYAAVGFLDKAERARQRAAALADDKS